MRVLAVALILIALALAAHLIWWRIRLPQSQTRALLVIFCMTLLVGFGIQSLLPISWPLRLFGFWEYAQVGLFHVAATLTYAEFYTVIEDESPSLTIVIFVYQSGDQGRVLEEIYPLIDDSAIVGRRLDAMVSAGLIKLESNKYRLAPAGRFWARIFHCGRQIYRLPLGG